ncbi:MAG TPA: hypothetical protein VM716_14385 [Gemmatimonadales bacterium]|nr:hypothetical protein [Gemmatimonadales bacterium]
MSRPADQSSAAAALSELLLRLLLGSPIDPDRELKGPDFWDPLLHVAGGNGVLLRAALALDCLGVEGPPRFLVGVAFERQRAKALFAGVQAVSRMCSRHQVVHLFPKAFQHYPDIGQDADLLVFARPSELAPVLEALRAEPRPGGFSNWVAATVRYAVPGCPGPLDVQFGTLGLVGEHARFAAQLVDNRTCRMIDHSTVLVPAVEDQLLLQGVQRIFGRLSLRIADVLWAIDALRHERLDWDYVLDTAGRVGVRHGIGCFLSYIEQIHRRVFGTGVLPPALQRQLPLDGWGTIGFRDGRYRFPALRANLRLSLGAFESKLARRDWAAAARLSLVPLLGVTSTFGRLSHEGGTPR